MTDMTVLLTPEILLTNKVYNQRLFWNFDT